MRLQIRPVREDDAAELVGILDPIIAAGGLTVMEGPLDVAGQRTFIRDFPDRGVFLVAVSEESGRIVGMQDVQPILGRQNAFRHVGDIATFVALDQARLGIGRRLCDATFAAARELGYRKITARIRADNPRALAFYQSQGFEIVAGRLVDEVLTERFLD